MFGRELKRKKILLKKKNEKENKTQKKKTKHIDHNNNFKKYNGDFQATEITEPAGSLLPDNWRARMGQRTALFR